MLLLRRLRRAVDAGGVTVHEKLLLLPMVSTRNATAILVVVIVVVDIVVHPARGHIVRVVASVAASKACDVAKPGVPPLHHHGLMLDRLHAAELLRYHVTSMVRCGKARSTAHPAAALDVLVRLGLLLLMRLVPHVLQGMIDRARITYDKTCDGCNVSQHHGGVQKKTFEPRAATLCNSRKDLSTLNNVNTTLLPSHGA